jgi:hypothetical protein
MHIHSKLRFFSFLKFLRIVLHPFQLCRNDIKHFRIHSLSQLR